MKPKDLKKLTKFFQKMGVESFRVGSIAVKFRQKQTPQTPSQLVPLAIEESALSDDDLKTVAERNLYWSSFNAR